MDTNTFTDSKPSPPLQWRIYLYGAGFIAHHHVAAALNLPSSSSSPASPPPQIFAADPSPSTLSAFSSSFPTATTFSSATTMLVSSPAREHDIVIICVPLYLHHSASLEALKSGRHVLCEKPVSKSFSELHSILSAAELTNRMFQECSIRYSSNLACNRAREIISGGGIGKIYHARMSNKIARGRPGIEYQPQSSWFLDKGKAGGGCVFDFGVYDICMLFDVLRPVAATIVRAWMSTPFTALGFDMKGVKFDVETHAGACIELTLQNGDTVVLDYERASGFHGEDESVLNIDGTHGGLSWQWLPTYDVDLSEAGAEEKFTLTHYIDVEGKVVVKNEAFPAFGWNEANARPLHAFIDLIEGRESIALSRERLEFNFAVVVGIYESAEKGEAVSVELKRC